MSAGLRAVLNFIGMTLACILSLGLWYGAYFIPDLSEQEAQVKRLSRQIAEAVEQENLGQIHNQIERFNYPIVLTSPEKRVVTSNLRRRYVEQRIEGGNAYLQNERIQGPVPLPGKTGYLYYIPISPWFNPAIFLLVLLSLMIGTIFSLVQYPLFLKLNRQKRAIEELSEYSDREQQSELEEKSTALKIQNKNLKAQLEQTRHNTGILQQEILKYKEKIRQTQENFKNREQQLQEARRTIQEISAEHEAFLRSKQQVERLEQKDIRLALQVEELNQLLKDKQQALNEAAAGRATWQRKHDELLNTHQAQADKLKKAIQRLRVFSKLPEKLTLQQHEIQKLEQVNQEKETQTRDLEKQKQHLLNVMDEKEQRLKQQQETIQQLTQRERELSIALKKEIELVQHLPTDLKTARQELARLIDEKDIVERENANLRTDLTDKQSEINRLKGNIKERALVIQDISQRLKTQETQVFKLEQELYRLGDTLADKLADLEKLNTDFNESQTLLQQTMRDRDRYKGEIEDLEEVLREAQDEKYRLTADKALLEEKLEAFEAEQYEFQMTQLKRAIRMLLAEKKTRIEGQKDLENKLEKLTYLYQSACQERDEQTAAVEKLKRFVDASRSMVDIMKKKLIEANVEV